MHIREQLKQGRILTDGAMGTYFETKYPGEEQMAEACNISAPDKIKQIHLEYLQSGAQLIRTNTFAANTMFFEDIDMVKKLIQTGYQNQVTPLLLPQTSVRSMIRSFLEKKKY